MVLARDMDVFVTVLFHRARVFRLISLTSLPTKQDGPSQPIGSAVRSHGLSSTRHVKALPRRVSNKAAVVRWCQPPTANCLVSEMGRLAWAATNTLDTKPPWSVGN